MPLIPLRAGPLQMALDAPNAFLRHLRCAGREVVRGIFGAVRDRNWGTVAPRVENLEIESAADRFAVRFRVICRGEGIDFTWEGAITGTGDGTVRFVFDGVAARSFLKNRIGLCVLHPIAECAGAPCRVEQTDGTVIEGEFPRFISPHQPFKRIRAITHEVLPGLRATVRVEGDTFEMEDHRNWTDASFKIYGTPLEESFPVRVEAGTRIRHVVTLTLDGRVPADIPMGAHANGPPRVAVQWGKSMARPPVGFGMATHGGALGSRVVAALRDLAPDHLRVDLDLAAGDGAWQDRLGEAATLAEAVGASLHVAVIFAGDVEGGLDAVLEAVRPARKRIALWMVLHAAEKVIAPGCAKLARRKLADAGCEAPVSAGTNAYFAELNRHRPAPDAAAFPCYSINPQVHAFDDLSLVETLEAQRATVESVRQFCFQPVVISPITLRPRFNPNATVGGPPAAPETDPRQGSRFAAAWTMGSLGRLLPCEGVHSLTYFETHGPRGVMADDGRAYPVAKVFAALKDFHLVCETASSDPLRFQVLGLRNQSGACRLLVASFSEAAETILANAPGTAEDLVIDLPAGGVAALDLPFTVR